jgi:hypothetical protein
MTALRRCSLASFTLFSFVMTPAAVWSQATTKPSDDPIPRELALALLNFAPGMAGTDIRVGRAPDDIPAELVPQGIDVLGSTTQFENSVIVLTAPQQPDSAITRIEAHLLASGWTKPPVPARPLQRGFVAADFPNFAYQQPDMLCRGDAFVTLTGSYRRSGGSVIRLTYNRGQRYSACRAREEVTVYRNPYDEAPVPTLRAPVGSMTKEGNGMSSSGQNSFSMSTRLATRLKPADVVTHYDKQMREQGWTQALEGSVPFLSARTYRKNDDKARTWTAVLVSMFSADSTEQDVMVRLARR